MRFGPRPTSTLRSDPARHRPSATAAAAGWLAGLGRRLGRPLYAVYAARLRDTVRAGPVPRHVAIVMDGNRRWAARQAAGADGSLGHRAGAAKSLEVVEWCARLGIPEVTLFALSVENLERAPGEVAMIFEAIGDAIESIVAGPRGRGHPFRLRVIGHPERLPERLRAAVERSAALASDAPMRVTIALAYSGRDELVEATRDAVRELVASGVPAGDLAARIDRDLLAAHLSTQDSPDPDLVIRTSGELRLSGFLLWQSAYSELYFSDVYWPAFREIDLLRAIRAYQGRQRRFGR